MKKVFLSLMIIMLSVISYGQKTMVKEQVISIGEGSHNALIVNIMGVEEDAVTKAWKSKMKGTKAKVSGKKGKMFADNASIPEISSNTIDIYSIISGKKDYVELSAAFDLGGAYLNSREHATAYEFARKMLYDFAIEISKEVIQSRLEKQEAVVKGLTKEKEKLEKENSKLDKNIEGYKKDISSAEKSIEDNKKTIEESKKNIEEAKKNLEENKSKLETKSKELEKQNEALKAIKEQLNGVE